MRPEIGADLLRGPIEIGEEMVRRRLPAAVGDWSRPIRRSDQSIAQQMRPISVTAFGRQGDREITLSDGAIASQPLPVCGVGPPARPGEAGMIYGTLKESRDRFAGNRRWRASWLNVLELIHWDRGVQ